MNEDKNFEDQARETAKNFGDGAKNAANDFKESWNQTTNHGENKKLICGILALIFGYLGIHKFILGYTKEGIIQIVVSVVTCGIGGLIGFIEGIIYLTKTDEEFYQTYQVGRKPWF